MESTPPAEDLQGPKRDSPDYCVSLFKRTKSLHSKLYDHSPWNYPVVLCLQPLIGAIAAGCAAVVKPSEVAPHVAQVLADLFPKYLDPSAFAVVNGAVLETTTILEVRIVSFTQ
jgi:aldehyde dehydrogenase (NAD+)